jgi:hypothetical protein
MQILTIRLCDIKVDNIQSLSYEQFKDTMVQHRVVENIVKLLNSSTDLVHGVIYSPRQRIRLHLVLYLYNTDLSSIDESVRNELSTFYTNILKYSDMDNSNTVFLMKIYARGGSKILEKWIEIAEDLFVHSTVDKCLIKISKIIDDEHQRNCVERSMKALIDDIKSA